MKKSIILILILICCGCTTKYSIEIDENLGVKENATALEDSTFFENYPKSSVESVVGMILEPNLEYLNKNGFEVSNVKKEKEAGVNISNYYETIEEYIQTSEIYKQFGEIEYIENDDEITLKVNGMLSNFEQDQSGKYLIDKSEISIKLPHKVKSHNADKVDKENGVYTWYIEEAGVERELHITFNKKIAPTVPIQYIVAGVMLLVALVVAYLIWSKVSGEKNKRNEI